MGSIPGELGTDIRGQEAARRYYSSGNQWQEKNQSQRHQGEVKYKEMIIPSYVMCVPSRRERAEAEMNKAGIVPVYYPAHLGNQLGITTIYTYDDDRIATGTLETEGHYFVGHNQLALNMTFFSVIKMALALGQEEIIVFEDDVVLCDNYQYQLDQLYRNIPSTADIIYLGHCCVRPGPRVNDYLKKGQCMCTHAAIYRKKAMEMINEKAILYTAVDIFVLQKVQPYLETLLCVPTLATQLSAEGKIPTTL